MPENVECASFVTFSYCDKNYYKNDRKRIVITFHSSAGEMSREELIKQQLCTCNRRWSNDKKNEKRTILKTAARSEGRGENLLAVAQESFWAKRNRSRFNVDQIDYVFLLEVGMKVLAGKERDEFMLDLLRQCKKDGLVSKRLVREVVRGPLHEEWPEEERQQIVQLLFGEELNFPTSWSRNVHKHDRPTAKDVCMSKLR